MEGSSNPEAAAPTVQPEPNATQPQVTEPMQASAQTEQPQRKFNLKIKWPFHRVERPGNNQSTAGKTPEPAKP